MCRYSFGYDVECDHKLSSLTLRFAWIGRISIYESGRRIFFFCRMSGHFLFLYFVLTTIYVNVDEINRGWMAHLKKKTKIYLTLFSNVKRIFLFFFFYHLFTKHINFRLSFLFLSKISYIGTHHHFIWISFYLTTMCYTHSYTHTLYLLAIWNEVHWILFTIRIDSKSNNLRIYFAVCWMKICGDLSE